MSCSIARKSISRSRSVGIRKCRRLAEALIARKIPFALEKPCGVNMSQVTRLRKLAEEANVYCAIPFIFRMSDLLAALEDAEGRIPSDFNYMSFRFIVGAPDRYEAAGAGWALDPVFSGGGSTINVATHFIDLFQIADGQGNRSSLCHHAFPNASRGRRGLFPA